MPKEEDNFDKFYEGLRDRNDDFLNVLMGKDDLGLIVRAHIHIEHELREFIISAAPSPNQVDFTEIDFNGTVRLALVLGLDKELKPALSAIGKLRNKFSHRLDMKLGKELPKDLIATLTPRRSSILKSAIKASIENTPSGYQIKGQNRTRLEVILFFAEIRTSVLEERHRVEKTRLLSHPSIGNIHGKHR